MAAEGLTSRLNQVYGARLCQAPRVPHGKPCQNVARLYNARAFPFDKPERGDSSLMFCDNKHRSSQNKIRSTRDKYRSTRASHAVLFFTLTPLLMVCGPGARAQAPAPAQDITSKLNGFDSYMEQTLKDWNTPGIGVGIVVNDKLVFAKGYGYRVYDKKLPFTPTTLCQIASNSKLFTAVSAGMLVGEGKLNWDKPVRESAPTIQFYDDQLNDNVTVAGMRSPRTGVSRDD